MTIQPDIHPPGITDFEGTIGCQGQCLDRFGLRGAWKPVVVDEVLVLILHFVGVD